MKTKKSNFTLKPEMNEQIKDRQTKVEAYLRLPHFHEASFTFATIEAYPPGYATI